MISADDRNNAGSIITHIHPCPAIFNCIPQMFLFSSSLVQPWSSPLYHVLSCNFELLWSRTIRLLMQRNCNSIYFSILTPDYTVIKYEISGLSLKSTILYKLSITEITEILLLLACKYFLIQF